MTAVAERVNAGGSPVCTGPAGKPGPMTSPPLASLRRLVGEAEGLEFAVLIGSRARGDAGAGSDWDLAVRWAPGLGWFDVLGRTETLRRRLAAGLAVPESAIDLVDLAAASLAMRAVAAEEGIPIKGEESLPWLRFLTRTWRELEEFYWNESHAA